MTAPTPFERHVRIMGVLFDEPLYTNLSAAGPHGLSCSCNIYSPCSACERRDREAEAFGRECERLIEAAVVERDPWSESDLSDADKGEMQ